MTGEQVIGELMALRHTVEKLKDPDILSVNVHNGQSTVHLYLIGDPTEVLGGAIDNDHLYRVEHDQPDGWDRCSITDTNGVEVFWLERKAALDVAASGAEEEKEVIIEYSASYCTSIGAGGRKVKEEA